VSSVYKSENVKLEAALHGMAFELAESCIETTRRYVARQPIFDAEQRLFGYELLYRDGQEDRAIIAPGMNASQDTLESSILIGLDALCGDRIVFLNCTQEVLLGPDLALLPAPQVVLEILEQVEPDEAVLSAIGRWKDRGFRIALDDFVPDAMHHRFLPWADVLKIDFHATTVEERRRLMHEFGDRYQLVAEKVETLEEFTEAKEAGFPFFQGFLLGRPELYWTDLAVMAER
jgi:c-di-GMP-related signal transduction protein